MMDLTRPGTQDESASAGAYVAVGLLPGDQIPTEVWVSWGDVCNIKDGRPCYSCQRARTLRMGKVVGELIRLSRLMDVLELTVGPAAHVDWRDWSTHMGGGSDASV